MKPRTWFFRTYLIIALVYGVFGFIDSSFVAFRYYSELYRNILMGLAFVFFFFNIGSMAVFRYHKVKKIAYVLPIYHVITYMFFMGIGFVLAAMGTVSDWILTSLIWAGILTSLFEIVFSAYLLEKLRVTSRQEL